MIKFIKNVKKLLPYDREEYFDYLGSGFYTNLKWYGVSFQKYDIRLNENIGLNDFVDSYENLIKGVVLKFDNDSVWVVNHDNKDLSWLPNNKNNLPGLRALFKQNNIQSTFKGAIVLSTEDLFMLCKELLSYPFVIFKDEPFNNESFFYKNLDISHSHHPFIIKIDTHFTVDLVSKEKDLLDLMIEKKSLEDFSVKPYKGTTDLPHCP